jgi:hypothetical protein
VTVKEFIEEAKRDLMRVSPWFLTRYPQPQREPMVGFTDRLDFYEVTLKLPRETRRVSLER